MAELERGSIVAALAGRDKGSFFAVLEVNSKEVVIANGKSRPIERPKRKNLRHISVTNQTLEEASMDTNKKIRKALSTLNKEL